MFKYLLVISDAAGATVYTAYWSFSHPRHADDAFNEACAGTVTEYTCRLYHLNLYRDELGTMTE